MPGDEGEDEELLLDDEIGDDLEAEKPEDSADIDAADEPEDADEFIVSFGDDEPDPAEVDDEKAPQWVKDLRKRARDANRLERENEELRKAQAPGKVEIGPKPTLESCDYDEEQFEAALDAWKESKAQASAAEKTAAEERQKLEQRGREIVGRYETAAKALPVKDFGAAQDAVRDALGTERLGFIVAGADSPEKLVYALAKNPARLAALAKIDIPARFVFEAAKLEKDMKIAPKRKAPEPDVAEKGSATLSGGDATERRLEKEAEKSGDRSALIRYRREKRDKA